MDEYFKSAEYLDYLKQHCNTVTGSAVGRVAGGDQIARHIARLTLSPTDEILEVGCGTGRVLEIIYRETGCLGRGCDLSSVSLNFLETARPAFAGRTRAIDSHGLAAYDSNFFDVVIYWGSFELVPQRAHIAELARILKPGGRAMLGSFKHSRPFADDREAQEALDAYRRKSFPVATGEPEAFERVLGAFGFSIAERLVFSRKSDLVSDRFEVDKGGARTFSEAIYTVRKERAVDAALPFSHFHGN